MLRMFYESVVATAVLYAIVCFGSRLRVEDTNRLNKLIRKASDGVGVKLDSLTVVSERRMLSKLRVILDNVSHPLHNVLASHRRSFLPVAIKLYNSSLRVSETGLSFSPVSSL